MLMLNLLRCPICGEIKDGGEFDLVSTNLEIKKEYNSNNLYIEFNKTQICKDCIETH